MSSIVIDTGNCGRKEGVARTAPAICTVTAEEGNQATNAAARRCRIGELPPASPEPKPSYETPPRRVEKVATVARRIRKSSLFVCSSNVGANSEVIGSGLRASEPRR